MVGARDREGGAGTARPPDRVPQRVERMGGGMPSRARPALRTRLSRGDRACAGVSRACADGRTIGCAGRRDCDGGFVTTVLVSGAIANKFRQGGAAWTRLNWILGLKKIGFDVYFVEQIGRESCVDAAGAVVPFDASENLKYFRTVIEQLGLGGAAALVY